MGDRHQDQISFADKNVKEIHLTVAKDYWRQNYHLTPPVFWMNDPNGFSYFKGGYHLFYQHHPFSPEWGPMHWGHFTSSDLVYWKQQPIALAPSEGYDKDGCFSGSAIENDDKLYLIYTGNVWTGENHDTDLKQVQALAVSEDGIKFCKLMENPVIQPLVSDKINPSHFRDPKVWKYQNKFYVVIGSKNYDNNGQVLLYCSHNLLDWEFISIMAQGEGNCGYMWECPDFFHLDNKDFLIISPQGVEKEGDNFHNLHQSVYLTGKLDYEDGIFKHGEFTMLDYGFDFYAPQTMEDEQGRRILIAWMDMWESEMPTQKNNWAGSMTIPRVLELINDKLIIKPLPELKALRKTEICFSNIKINGLQELNGINGDSIELDITIKMDNANLFEINLRENKELNARTVLTYLKNDSLLILNRNNSGKGSKGIRRTSINLSNNILNLRIFIDKSSVEIFINNGEKVMSARIYPSEESTGISFYSDSIIEIINLQKWDLDKSIDFNLI